MLKEFINFDNYRINAGSMLTFFDYNYFLYDGGYTFSFEEDGFRLAELDEENAQVLNSFSEYFEMIE